MLRKGWIFPRGSSSTDMKSGVLNEASVLKSVGRQDWCNNIFECGLFQSKEFPCLAVSPDGVAEINLSPRPMGTCGPDLPPVLAAVEIKTRLAPNMITKAFEKALTDGPFFSCSVGDETWRNHIPDENKAQVLHQATVLGLDHVVFVTAYEKALITSCVVKVSAENRQVYAAAITKHESLMAWALESIETVGAPPTPPNAFSSIDAYILSTHIRVWRALRKRIKEGVPIYPIRIFKTIHQVLYCKTKGGIDGNTRHVANLTGKSKYEYKDGVGTKLAIRAIKHMVVNAYTLSKVLRVGKSQSVENLTLKMFRQRANRLEPLSRFADGLSMELFLTAQDKKAQLQAGIVPMETVENNGAVLTRENIIELQETVKGKRKRKAKVALFNTGDHKKLRLSNYNGCVHVPNVHKSVTIGKTIVPALNKNGEPNKLVGLEIAVQQHCILCTKKTTIKCSACDLALCLHNQSNNTKSSSCYDRWHSLKRIDL